ncbi:MAG: hypothetical protein CVU71_16250 [Deltaproteobacteria bacterium HGW-Deltaproteobacteria-6]|nr:MAG: hypothetical protein CVU71_16250 [Deltaproteobacteria bacterium HGW-Deltaproteobacteria-6]
MKTRLTLTGIDTGTSEDRARERHRRITLTALSSGAAKVISFVAAVITVPLTLNYLGAERYGLWMTISSVIAMMVFADFGVGNGLMNAITEAYGKDDIGAIRSHITNALLILTLLMILILLVFFAIYPLIPWNNIFNVKSAAAIRETGPAVASFMVCFAVGVPAGIVQRVQMGMQQGFWSSLWQTIGSILSVLSILFVIYVKADLMWLVMAMAGSPIVSLLANGIIFFFVRRRDLLPRFSDISAKGMKRILHGGLIFFVLQLAVSIAFASDNIILARMLGAESVTQYSIVSRLFEGVLIIIAIAFTPLWPAYGEANARGDHLWVRQTLNRSMILTLIFTVCAAGMLVLFYKPIFALWVGSDFVLPFMLVALCAGWMVLKGLGVTYSMFLNGVNAIRLQLIIATGFTIVSIAAKIFFVGKFGVNGLLMAMIGSYVLLVVVPYTFLNNRILSHE